MGGGGASGTHLQGLNSHPKCFCLLEAERETKTRFLQPRPQFFIRILNSAHHMSPSKVTPDTRAHTHRVHSLVGPPPPPPLRRTSSRAPLGGPRHRANLYAEPPATPAGPRRLRSGSSPLRRWLGLGQQGFIFEAESFFLKKIRVFKAFLRLLKLFF